jgi:hypothetical protein
MSQNTPPPAALAFMRELWRTVIVRRTRAEKASR